MADVWLVITVIFMILIFAFILGVASGFIGNAKPQIVFGLAMSGFINRKRI